MKKILLLGGSRYLLPVIETIHRLGHYAITCDYLPDNIAHKYSDEYHNVSIIDKDTVLELAQELQIDGIMSFACDPGVVTAAYVAEKMNLPFQGSYESVRILQDKGLFRKFLQDNGFNCPNAKSYTSKLQAIEDIDYYNWPVIVKPVDSAGSKGVIKVEERNQLNEAIEYALSESHSEQFIIEDFLEFDGYHSCADNFVLDGKLVFGVYADHLFDEHAANPFTPAACIWPSSMKNKYEEYLSNELQRLINLLNLNTGIYNIETCVATDGKAYIMEVSPRGGGNGMAELQKMAYGVDLIEAEIKKSIGELVGDIATVPIDGVWCELAVHNSLGRAGIFKELVIDADIQKNNIKLISMDAYPGDYVEPFTGANKLLGNIFLRFDTREQLDEAIKTVDDWIKIVLEDKK